MNVHQLCKYVTIEILKSLYTCYDSSLQNTGARSKKSHNSLGKFIHLKLFKIQLFFY